MDRRGEVDKHTRKGLIRNPLESSGKRRRGVETRGGFLYNRAMPHDHLEEMNVIMIDGHAERMTPEDFLDPGHSHGADES